MTEIFEGAPESMNETRTCTEGDAELARPRSTDVLRDLFVIREKHGATSAVGHHASNIAELLQLPNPPAFQLKKQRDGLQRALADGE